jgi:putative FmdB family regulatory protein
MPTYHYRCTKCEHEFELFHGIKDETTRRCPRCNSKAKRVPAGGAGLLFKGSGFYITDYRSKGYKEKAKQEKGGGKDSGGGKESGGAKESGGSKGSSGSKGAHGSKKSEGA